jgi:esterase
MSLFYRKYGNGEPIVFLHGLLGMSDHWVSIAKAFEKDYTVYIPDLRNHGRSFHSETFNYSVMCDDLKEMFDENNIAEAFIVGHSMGGKLAMLFTDTYPEAVKKFVIADMGIKEYSSKPFEEFLKKINCIEIKHLKNRQQAENILSEMKFEKGFVQLIIKNISFDSNGTAFWKFDLNSIRLNLKEIHKKIEFRNIISQSALFIYGGQSNFIRSADIPEIKKHFSNVNFFKMGNASHWLHADDPETIIREIKTFLKS